MKVKQIDSVYCNGKTYKVAEIISYDEHCDGINMEFIDDKGIYRIYKSFFDGGHVNYKEVENERTINDKIKEWIK